MPISYCPTRSAIVSFVEKNHLIIMLLYHGIFISVIIFSRDCVILKTKKYMGKLLMVGWYSMVYCCRFKQPYESPRGTNWCTCTCICSNTHWLPNVRLLKVSLWKYLNHRTYKSLVMCSSQYLDTDLKQPPKTRVVFVCIPLWRVHALFHRTLCLVVCWCQN